MAGESGMGLGVFVGGVIVQYDMDELTRRNIPPDPVQKADELLIAIASHVLADDRAFQNSQRSDQHCRTIALEQPP